MMSAAFWVALLLIIAFVVFSTILLILYCIVFAYNRLKKLRKAVLSVTGHDNNTTTDDHNERIGSSRDPNAPPGYVDSLSHPVYNISSMYPLPDLEEARTTEDLSRPPPYSSEPDSYSPPTYYEVSTSYTESNEMLR